MLALTGTAGADEWVVSSEPSLVVEQVGVEQTTHGNPIVIDGGDGTDTVTVTCPSASTAMVALESGGGTVQWGGQTWITLTNVENIVVIGKSGSDTATLQDTTASDYFYGRPDTSTMRAADNAYVNRVDGFHLVVGNATDDGNVNLASFYDSFGTDIYIAYPDSSEMRWDDGSTCEGYGFNYNYGYAESVDGLVDYAYLFDTPGETDELVSKQYQNTTWINFASGSRNRAKLFENVKIVGHEEDGDWARMYGTDQSDEFVSKPDLISSGGQSLGQMYHVTGEGYTNRSYGFAEVWADGRGGYDKARLYGHSSGWSDTFTFERDTSGDNSLFGRMKTELGSSQFITTARNFEYIRGLAMAGGTDTATISPDATGDYLYKAIAGTGKLDLLPEAGDFDGDGDLEGGDLDGNGVYDYVSVVEMMGFPTNNITASASQVNVSVLDRSDPTYQVSQNGTTTTYTANACTHTLTNFSGPENRSDAGGPYLLTEGHSLTLTGMASVPIGSTPTIDSQAWDLDNNGTYETTGSTAPFSASDNGTYPISYRATNNGVVLPVVSGSVLVLNAPPEVTPSANLTTNEGIALTNATLATFTDAGTLDTHTATIDWGDGTSVVSGTITESAGSGTVTGTHTYDVVGMYTVTVTVTDDDGDARKSLLTIEVIVNAAPVLDVNQSLTVMEGDTQTLTTEYLSASDPDDDASALTYMILVNPSYGRLERSTNPGVPITSFTQQEINDGAVRYVHDGSEPATDSFQFGLQDDDLMGPSGLIFSILITPVNDVPVVTAVSDLTAAGTTLSNVTLATFIDAETTDTHTATIYWGDGTSSSGTVTESNGSGTVKGSHGYSSSGTYSGTVHVTDNTGVSGNDTFEVTVDLAAPVVDVNQSMTLAEGGMKTLTTEYLSASDPDDDASALTYMILVNPSYGRLERSTNPGVPITSFTQQEINDGAVRYVHDGSEPATDSFLFGLQDDDLMGPSGLIFSILITPVNDVPVVTAVSDLTAAGTTLSNVTLATFIDAETTDTHTATIYWGDGTSSSGTVTESNGSGTVKGSHGYSSSGTYSGTVHVTDNTGVSGNDTFEVTVGTVDLVITGFSNYGEQVRVDYWVDGFDSDAFDIGLYATSDNVTFDLLTTHSVTATADLTVGGHSVVFTPDFYGIGDDDHLIARLDDYDDVTEANELNNQRQFDSGIFRTADNTLYLLGRSGDDTVNMTEANNQIHVLFNGVLYSYADTSLDNVRMHVYEGNDVINAGISQEDVVMWVFAGEGNDTVTTGAGDDHIYGGPGDELSIQGGAGNDAIFGEAGIDNIWGGGDDDYIHGGEGADFLYGEDGHDIIEGGTGSSNSDGTTIEGGNGNDSLLGTNQNDTINGGPGDDWIDGAAGNDTLQGEDGNDTLYGGPNNDFLYGGPGHDDLFGEAGDDNLYGEDDDDNLDGGGDFDILDGGPGFDNPEIIDNTEPRFSSSSGGAIIPDGNAYKDDYHEIDGYGGASWNTSGAGGFDEYELYATWVSGADREPDAVYEISNGTDSLEVPVNQQTSAPTVSLYDHNWELLGNQDTFLNFTPTSIELYPTTISTTTTLSADAVMIVPHRPILNLTVDSNNDGTLDTTLGGDDDQVEMGPTGQIIAIGPTNLTPVQIDLDISGANLTEQLEFDYDDSLIQMWVTSKGPSVKIPPNTPFQKSSNYGYAIEALAPLSSTMLTVSLFGQPANTRPISDTVRVSTVSVDIDVDSNNDGIIKDALDDIEIDDDNDPATPKVALEEQSPGKVLAVGIGQRKPVKVKANMKQASSPDGVSFSIDYDDTKIRLYNSTDVANGVFIPSGMEITDTSPVKESQLLKSTTLFMDGIELGETDITLKVVGPSANTITADTVHVTVALDLDTDSDNDGTIEPTPNYNDFPWTEDMKEDQPRDSGKFVLLNKDDDNANGKPDKDDDHSAYTGNTTDDDLTRIKTTFSGVDYAKLDNHELWLARNNGLRLYSGQDKELLSGGTQDSIWYKWTLGSSATTGPNNDPTWPSEVWVEGVSTGLHHVGLRLVEATNKKVVAGDIVQITVIVGADLTAHRPMHEGGAGSYAPFAKTPVKEVDEESSTLGPGIRINSDHDYGGGRSYAGLNPDMDSSHQCLAENDLIEVIIQRTPGEGDFRLRRSRKDLKVWTSPSKGLDKAVYFDRDDGFETSDLSHWDGNGSTKTVWVEWAAREHGFADLEIIHRNGRNVTDKIKFHTFHNISIVLGGRNQTPVVPTPASPLDPNHGFFHMATDLYQEGYDVYMYDEDDVWISPVGEGPVYEEILDAVIDRDVTTLAIMGYSHGGGSLYDLAVLIEQEKQGGGDLAVSTCDLVYTAYVDAVNQQTAGAENNGPPGTQWHLNLYQEQSYLSGGPITKGPITQEFDVVDSASWNLNVDHSNIDDHLKVLDWVKLRYRQRVNQR